MKIGIVILAGSTIIAAISVAGILTSSDDIYENKIRIAYFPNIGHAIPIVGMEKGFFEEYLGNQTKIETRVFDSGPQAIESLFANS
ncbi:MAG: sulfate ABC transporter substrate-binding protein, partial [Nitrosopumilus sp.]|nr:sulfate ABC transporter substrate-binding protein [Nitrosopumilus sp.]